MRLVVGLPSLMLAACSAASSSPCLSLRVPNPGWKMQIERVFVCRENGTPYGLVQASMLPPRGMQPMVLATLKQCVTAQVPASEAIRHWRWQIRGKTWGWQDAPGYLTFVNDLEASPSDCEAVTWQPTPSVTEMQRDARPD